MFFYDVRFPIRDVIMWPHFSILKSDIDPMIRSDHRSKKEKNKVFFK